MDTPVDRAAMIKLLHCLLAWICHTFGRRRIPTAAIPCENSTSKLKRCAYTARTEVTTYTIIHRCVRCVSSESIVSNAYQAIQISNTSIEYERACWAYTKVSLLNRCNVEARIAV